MHIKNLFNLEDYYWSFIHQFKENGSSKFTLHVNRKYFTILYSNKLSIDIAHFRNVVSSKEKTSC